MNTWDNPANYKKCQKKSYEIAVCMPPVDTVVINKLEQADVLKMLGNKPYFTVEELKKLSPNDLNVLQGLIQQGRAYVVSQAQPFVLCGTLGEMWTATPQVLAKKYTFLSNGQPVAINNNTLQERMKDGQLNWTRIHTVPDNSKAFACFVPSKEKGQIATSWGAVLNINGVGVSHGKGDFVIAQMLPNGQPNMADRYVVNGDIFATTYNNQGWADCLSNKYTGDVSPLPLDKLPRLITNYVGRFSSMLKSVAYEYEIFSENVITRWLQKNDYSELIKPYNEGHFYVKTGRYDAFLVLSNDYCIGIEPPNVAAPSGDIGGVFELNNQNVDKILADVKSYRSELI